MAKLDKEIDRLYIAPPQAFTAERNALVKRLRTDGEGEEAARVKALRRPSKAAAVLNGLALSQPKGVKKYLGLAEKLRQATSGKIDAARMRKLAREEGELLEELVAEAGQLSDGASASTLDRVRETLQAAQVDPELRERVLAGRVEREERAASVGLANLAAPPEATRRRSKPSPKGRPGKASTATADRRKADAERKRREDAKAELTEAKAAAREAARDVARAEATLGKAERARDAADRKAERAEAKLEGV